MSLCCYLFHGQTVVVLGAQGFLEQTMVVCTVALLHDLREQRESREHKGGLSEIELG
jgi:hypothetical protein